MNIYNINIELKQISPMLHFQGEENGATIRATELKPKLDRFILSWIAFENSKITWNKNDLNSETLMLDSCVKELVKEHRDWFIDKTGEKHALNYKVRIRAGQSQSMQIYKMIGRKKEYYGNVSYILNQKNNVHQSIYHKSIEVMIKCFNEDLQNKIINLFPLFIDSTAFGLQQGKGYGKFKVSKINQMEDSTTCEKNLIKIVNHFNKNNIKNLMLYELDYVCEDEKSSYRGEIGVALDTIAKYNQILKSGINEKTGVYQESILLKKYFKEGNLNKLLNEKKAMKAYLTSKGINLKCDDKYRKDYSNINIKEAKYMRGYFGFAQVYMFLDTDDNHNKVLVTSQFIDNEKKTHSLRVSSPLKYHISTFKDTNGYNDCNIYILVNLYSVRKLKKLNPDICFRLKGRNNKFIAKLPEFDMEDFFEYLLKQKIFFSEKDEKIKSNVDKGFYLKKVTGVK